MIWQLTKADFLDQIFDFELNKVQRKNTTPCVVYFYTEINNVCFIQNGIFERLHEAHENIIFYKVDALCEQILTADLGIRHVPTFLFIPVENAMQMTSGVLSEQTFKKISHRIFGIEKL